MNMIHLCPDMHVVFNLTTSTMMLSICVDRETLSLISNIVKNCDAVRFIFKLTILKSSRLNFWELCFIVVLNIVLNFSFIFILYKKI